MAFPAYAAFEVTQLKANLHKGISKRDLYQEISKPDKEFNFVPRKEFLQWEYFYLS